MRGLFITFEGGEGAGKTTLIESLLRELTSQGHRVLKTREPGGTPFGEEVRNLLLHQKAISPYAELSLFLASRAEHIVEVIQPALKRGEIVLCDRFNDSSVAYQGMARGLGMKEVAAFCKFISQGCTPDLTFYLDIDPAMGLQRVKASRGATDRIEKEALAFHQKIREGFLTIHKEEPHRFHKIDATLPPSKVFEEALNKVLSHV